MLVIWHWLPKTGSTTLYKAFQTLAAFNSFDILSLEDSSIPSAVKPRGSKITKGSEEERALVGFLVNRSLLAKRRVLFIDPRRRNSHARSLRHPTSAWSTRAAPAGSSRLTVADACPCPPASRENRPMSMTSSPGFVTAWTCAVNAAIGSLCVGQDPPMHARVGTFIDGLPWMCCGQERASDCWCARAFRDLRVFSVERDNAAKNLLPYLRGRCESIEQAHPNGTWAAPHYWLEPPELFLHFLLDFMDSRHRLRLSSEALPVPLAHKVHFEDFQRDVAGATRELMASIGLGHAFDAGAIMASPLLQKPRERYASPEVLSDVLLNFDAIEEVLGREWPCALAHLKSKSPERLPACPVERQDRIVKRSVYGPLASPPKARLLECIRGACVAFEQHCAVDEVTNAPTCEDVAARPQPCTERDREVCSASKHALRGWVPTDRDPPPRRVCMLT